MGENFCGNYHYCLVGEVTFLKEYKFDRKTLNSYNNYRCKHIDREEKMTKEEFVLLALEYLDYPSSKYTVPGRGVDTDGFDCSGFLTYLFRKIKFPGPIPRHCNEYFDSFGIFVHEYQTGDLVFFSKNSRGKKPDHVGIMVSKTRFIHSPGKDGTYIKIERLSDHRRGIQPADLEGRGQIYIINPIGFKRPAIRRGRYYFEFFEKK